MCSLVCPRPIFFYFFAFNEQFFLATVKLRIAILSLTSLFLIYVHVLLEEQSFVSSGTFHLALLSTALV